jgi:hypothetical protein
MDLAESAYSTERSTAHGTVSSHVVIDGHLGGVIISTAA